MLFATSPVVGFLILVTGCICGCDPSEPHSTVNQFAEQRSQTSRDIVPETPGPARSSLHTLPLPIEPAKVETTGVPSATTTDQLQQPSLQDNTVRPTVTVTFPKQNAVVPPTPLAAPAAPQLQPRDSAEVRVAEVMGKSSEPPAAPIYNDLILRAIKSMPKKGGYAITVTANAGLRKAIVAKRRNLDFLPTAAQPSYCSGATYQVFLHALQEACDRRNIRLSGEVLKALLFSGQQDGVGVWGRWNANGPGTARLFYETGLGVNFDDIKYAIPGDFLKLFWNEHIGKQESGHSVVYLGIEQPTSGEPILTFWSSNQPEGYGEKSVPLSKVKRLIFSRLINPKAVATLAELGTDNYLKDMLVRDGTNEELVKLTGMRK